MSATTIVIAGGRGMRRSGNGGDTFDQVLVATTPNDGSQDEDGLCAADDPPVVRAGGFGAGAPPPGGNTFALRRSTHTAAPAAKRSRSPGMASGKAVSGTLVRVAPSGWPSRSPRGSPSGRTPRTRCTTR